MKVAKPPLGKRVTFQPYYAVNTEGHRIGIMSCEECGAAVLVQDDGFDAGRIHERWHLDQRHPAPEEKP